MEDTKLREFLGINTDADRLRVYDDTDGKLGEILAQLKRLKSLLMVENYFKDCPCCDTWRDRELIKTEAVSFKKLGSYGQSVTNYTTKESYRVHEIKIKEWEKELAEYKIKKPMQKR